MKGRSENGGERMGVWRGQRGIRGSEGLCHCSGLFGCSWFKLGKSKLEGYV